MSSIKDTGQIKLTTDAASPVDCLVIRNGAKIYLTPSGKNSFHDKFVGSDMTLCPNCGTPWEDEKAVLHCPCLDA